MTKEAKMLAVVEAMRRAIAEWDSDGEMDVSPMRAALADLDAHTEADAEAGETVEVSAAVSWNTEKREWYVAGYPGWEERCGESHPYWQHVATITARIPRPAVPTIPATVTREGGR